MHASSCCLSPRPLLKVTLFSRERQDLCNCVIWCLRPLVLDVRCLLAAGEEPLQLAQLRALASIMGAVPASCKASSKALEELVVEHALLSSTAAPALRLAASHVLASLPRTAGDHFALISQRPHVIEQSQ